MKSAGSFERQRKFRRIDVPLFSMQPAVTITLYGKMSSRSSFMIHKVQVGSMAARWTSRRKR